MIFGNKNIYFNKNDMMKLWWYLLFIMLFVTIVLSLIIHRFIPHDSKFGDVGALLQGTLGIAVSLSGVYVAILLASNANEMILNERRQESLRLVNELFNEGLRPILQVVRHIERLYALFLALNHQVRTPLITKLCTDRSQRERITAPVDSEVKDKVVRYKRALAEQLTAIADSLEEVEANLYSKILWRKQPQRHDQMLNGLLESELASRVDVYQALLDYAGIIRMQVTDLTENSEHITLEYILRSRAMADSIKPAWEGDRDYLLACNLVELGAEIWTRVDSDGAINRGLALLLDLIQAVPTPLEVIQMAEQHFSDIVSAEILQHSPFAQIAAKERSFFGLALEISNDFITRYRIRTYYNNNDFQNWLAAAGGAGEKGGVVHSS
jgi:hypothetical protein